MKNWKTSGVALRETVATNTQKEMENGVATVQSVEARVSNDKGHAGLVISFADSDDLDNESKGHNEYLSLSSADVLIKSISKLRYLAEHSLDKKAQAIFDKLPDAVNPICLDEDGEESLDSNDEPNMKDVVLFKTNNEFAELVAEHPDKRLTWMWADNDDDEKMLFEWTVSETKYQKALVHAFSQFIDEEYSLTFNHKGDFQRMLNIKPADIS